MISIIVPVYNVEKYLRQCLDSIQQQSFTDWEAILVDDGSSDASPEICDQYAKEDRRFRVVHQENQGSSKARANGIKEAKGDWFAFVDSDDYVEADYLSSMMSAAEKSHADVVVSAYYSNYGEKADLSPNRPSALDRKTVITDTLNNLMHAGLWNKLFHRSVVEKVDFPPYSYYEDMVFWIRSLYACKQLAYNPVPSYHYRVNPASLTNSSDVDKRVKMFEEMSMNLTIVNNQFHLTDDPYIRKAFYYTINCNKIVLITQYYHHVIKMKRAMRFFPESYVYLPRTTSLDKYCYIAIRYRLFFPFFISELKRRMFRG